MSRLVLRSLSVLAATGLLAACSAMPEWTKPTTWYDGVTDANKPAESKPAEAAKAPDQLATSQSKSTVTADQPTTTGTRIVSPDKITEFPNLSAQPEPREATSTDSQRREIRDSLVADRDRAQHSADELRGGTAPAAAPPAPAVKKNAANPAAPADGQTDPATGDQAPKTGGN